MVDSNNGSITDAICWIQQTEPQKTPFKTNIVEGLILALAHSDAQAIYIFANKEDTLRALDGLQEKVSNYYSSIESFDQSWSCLLTCVLGHSVSYTSQYCSLQLRVIGSC